ncbi:MAG: hypothetical protein R6V50_06930 [Thermoplasmatota archaeon]
MRKKNIQSYTLFILLFLLILLSTLTLAINNVTANSENELIILLFESNSSSWKPLQEDILIEGKEYDIVVKQNNEITAAYDVTITISAFEAVYITNPEMPWVSFTAPSFEQHNEFIIRASKQGYVSSEKQVVISKGDLLINFDRETVEEQGSFCITVTDKNNNPVPEAITYISSHDYISETTDTYGKAYMRAPLVNDDSDILINVVKSGYFPQSKTIRVIHTENSIFSSLISTIFNISPIFIAALMVLFSMLFVNFRKNKPLLLSRKYDKNTNLKKEHKQTNPYPSMPMRNNLKTSQQQKKEVKPALTSKGSHVEIIRIRKNEDKQKQINEFIATKKENKKLIPPKQNEYEWFTGTDYAKFKINKLTGTATESTVDKWFIGENMFQFKLDKKVIDKKQKKKENT